ncbi:MAG: hypothetical protein PWR19_1838 [Carnobacterium sp.]|uniref:LTA synthase family protein n=1 Tax=Carnobacterium sp. TaxID=48221 RepID=UPI002649BB93|nr:LTA synthase family protein [Carnobacterium sp.]MDN5372792.1 hypothetical protein [Carnobacterium sp.]
MEKTRTKTKKNEKIQIKWLNVLKTILATICLGISTALIGNFILQVFQNQFDFERAVNYMFFWETRLYFLGALVLFIIYMWLVSLIGNRWISSIGLLILTLCFGIATQQKMVFRGEPLYPSDLSMIKEWRFLIQMVDIKIVIAALAGIGLAIILCVFLVKKTKKNQTESKRLKWFSRGIIFIVTSMALVYISNFNQLDNHFKESFSPSAYWVPFSQQLNYKNNGFIPGFLYNLNAPAVDKPTNYSEEYIEELVLKYKDKANEINQSRTGSLSDTNIIYVMNESFSDPYALDGINISEDPIPKIRISMKSHLSGKVLSQGLGGGTANIEFEALTGLSMEPMAPNITTPYSQLTANMENFPSISSYLKNEGFATTAIHPFNTTMYKRNEVYKKLEFDTFIDETTISHNKIIEQNRYISDESSYKEVMDQIQNSKETDFIHLVTMQNHMDYSGKYPNTRFKFEGAADNNEAVNYLQDIEYSDIALQELLDTLDIFSEDTMVIFWGDHLPGFYGNEIADLNGRVKMHETPLVMYTNFDKKEEYIDTISPIYFINHILEKNDAPVQPFHALLRELEKVLPAFEKGIYLEEGASELKITRDELNDETIELLEDYDTVMYDITTGSNYAEKLGFYE